MDRTFLYHKEFPARPDYKVCTQTFNAEGYEKWVTEDSDRYMYGTEDVSDEVAD